MKRLFFAIISLLSAIATVAQVDYAVASVNEEKGIELQLITNENDCVAMPQVKRNNGSVNWLSNRIIGLSHDGRYLAYISARNNTTDIYLKDIDNMGNSIQRTNRQSVLDLSYSPDDNYICFTEINGNNNNIFQTNANSGYVCRQITSGTLDYSPVYDSDMKKIFFVRQENKTYNIWSYNLESHSLVNCTKGINPYPIKDQSSLLCTRFNNTGRGEIWRINYSTGVEECILTDPIHSFTTPQLSPDGQWILIVGSNMLMNGMMKYYNTDIFVCRIDGTSLKQLTYHAADDLSPIWSNDGKYIYFISQRGSSRGKANIWKMTFNVQE